jgi:hypothetical protein
MVILSYQILYYFYGRRYFQTRNSCLPPKRTAILRYYNTNSIPCLLYSQQRLSALNTRSIKIIIKVLINLILFRLLSQKIQVRHLILYCLFFYACPETAFSHTVNNVTTVPLIINSYSNDFASGTVAPVIVLSSFHPVQCTDENGKETAAVVKEYMKSLTSRSCASLHFERVFTLVRQNSERTAFTQAVFLTNSKERIG